MPGISYVADPQGDRQLLLEGLTLLFHPASGMTHILAPPSPEILAVLAEPGNAAEVIERLGARFDVAAGESIVATVSARLAELEASGLVRRA